MDPPNTNTRRKDDYLSDDETLHHYNNEISFIADYEENSFYKETVRNKFRFYLESILDPECNLNDNELYDVYRALTRYKEYKNIASDIRKRIKKLFIDNQLSFITDHHLTMRTIEWYSMKKSPAYKKIHKDTKNGLLASIFKSFNEIDILKYYFYVLHLFFSYDAHNKALYFYSEKDNKWILDSAYAILSNKITEETCNLNDKLKRRIEELRREKERIQRQLRELQEKQEKDKEDESIKNDIKNLSDEIRRIERIIDSAESLIYKISQMQFTRRLKMSILDFFVIHELHLKLDSNPALTGTQNGVIEIIGKSAIFREGKPEDYISKSMGTYLIREPIQKVAEERYMKKLTNWLNKVFMDSDLINYFIRVCSSLLYRKNREKLFFIMTGSGDNSKSAIKKLIETTLGDYSFTLPNDFLTRKDKIGHKTELYSTKFRSACFIQENDVTDILVSGKIKELTGNDTIYSREIFQKGENQNINFRCFLMCNEVPSFTNIDNAIKRRIVIIPFESKWVHNPPATKEERNSSRTFKLKVDFEENIPKMAPYFLYVMFHNYREYEEKGIGFNKCEYIINFMNSFWEENDPYVIFRNEYIKYEEGEIMKLDELVTKFKEWMSEVFNNVSSIKINRTTIKNGFENLLGKSKRGVFENFKCTYSKRFDDLVS